MGEVLDLGGRVRGRQGDDGRAGGEGRFQAVEAVLEGDAVGRGGAQQLGGFQVAVRGRLAAGDVLRRDDPVEEGGEFRTGPEDIAHLGLVAARDDGGPQAHLPEGADERDGPFHIGEVHLGLEGVQAGRQAFALRLERTAEPLVVDLGQRLSFDRIFQARPVRVVPAELASPEAGVLRFRIEDDPVQVEKCGFESRHRTDVFESGCEDTVFLFQSVDRQDGLRESLFAETRSDFYKWGIICPLRDRMFWLRQF